MKIQKYNTIQDIPLNEKNACLAGRWNHWRRVFIVKADAQYQVFTLNFLQRFAAAFLDIFQFSYFKMILGGKEIKILGPKDLNPTAKKVAQQAPQQTGIIVPEPPAAPQGTQPNNLLEAPAPRTFRELSPEIKREFTEIFQNYAPYHFRDETRAYMRGLYRNNPEKLRQLEIYLNRWLPAGPKPPLPHIPGLTQEDVRRFETQFDYWSHALPMCDITRELRDAFSLWDRETRDKLEVYLEFKVPHLAPHQVVPAPQVNYQAPPQNLVGATPDLNALPPNTRPLKFTMAPNELSQFNRSGDRFKSSCALMAAAYLAVNKDATPQVIEEAILSPVNPASGHLELGDDQVAKYRHGANKLETVPAFPGVINDHTVVAADWPGFMQNQFDLLFHKTNGCLILSNSKTYCIRRMSNGKGIELFDSHGYSQMTGANGGYVAEFRDLKHLKEFLGHFQPFQTIVGGQAGFAVLFAKSVPV